MINPYSPSSKVDDSSVLPLRGLCRSTATFTEFDVRNMTLYTWLLVAEEDGAGLDELAESILKFDLTNNRVWAIRVTRSYLQRARALGARLSLSVARLMRRTQFGPDFLA